MRGLERRVQPQLWVLHATITKTHTEELCGYLILSKGFLDPEKETVAKKKRAISKDIAGAMYKTYTEFS